MEMDRQLAERIIEMRLQDEKLSKGRIEIMDRLDVASWDQVCTKALDFLIKERDRHVKS